MRKKVLYITLLINALAYSAFAQKPNQRWEVGLFLGASNYLGDLAPTIAFEETKAVAGASIKKNISEYFAWSLNVNYGLISGNDNNFKHLEARNLNFQTDIFEISPQLEFNFFRFGTTPRAKRFSPFVYTGISYFAFNPKAKYNDKWYRLNNLSTEGQGVVDGAPKKYQLWSIAIPIGAGFKFNLNDKWNLSVHGAYRTTFTDYLDDVSGQYVDRGIIDEKKGPAAAYFSDPSVERTGGIPLGKPGSQRGNPHNKDWYIFTGVTISYILQSASCYTF